MEIATISQPQRMFSGGDGRWASERLLKAMKKGKPLAPARLRTNDTLRRDEWKHFDDIVIEEGKIRLRGIADLVSAGLTKPVPNAMGKMIYQWETVNDMNPAEVSLSGITQTENDRLDFEPSTLPLPITHKDFHIDLRALAASRERGEPLDTTQLRMAARLVNEMLEQMLFQGGKKFAGSTIYGYTTHPNRNTRSLPLSWTNGSKTGALILTDVTNMMQDARDDRFYGPYNLYIPSAYEKVLDGDFKDASDKTIRQRLLELDSLNKITVVDQLTADNVVLVQMTEDVVALADGEAPQTIQWDVEGGLRVKFKVMAIQVPLIRADAQGRSGVVHMS